MVVPDLAIHIKLDETDTSFHQAASDQAAAAIGITLLLPYAVQLLRVGTFLLQVQGIGCCQLHSRGQLVTGNPRCKPRLTGPLPSVPLINLVDECSFGLSNGIGF